MTNKADSADRPTIVVGSTVYVDDSSSGTVHGPVVVYRIHRARGDRLKTYAVELADDTIIYCTEEMLSPRFI